MKNSNLNKFFNLFGFNNNKVLKNSNFLKTFLVCNKRLRVKGNNTTGLHFVRQKNFHPL
jgi:hypothetical protein